MSSTRSARSRSKRNSTSAALNILNDIKRPKPADERGTQSARPARQVRNVPRAPRRDLFDIPRPPEPAPSRSPAIQSSPLAAVGLNRRSTRAPSDIWDSLYDEYDEASVSSESSHSPATESSPPVAPEPTPHRLSTRLRSVRTQNDEQRSPRRTSIRAKRADVNYQENEDGIEEGDSWQPYSEEVDEESESATGEQDTVSREEDNDLLNIELFSDEDREPSPSALQLGETLEQSGRFQSTSSTPDKNATLHHVPKSITKSPRVQLSTEKSHKSTPTAAARNPSVVISSPNNVPETPLSRRSTRIRPQTSEVRDDDGDVEMDEPADETLRDNDVEMDGQEDWGVEDGDDIGSSDGVEDSSNPYDSSGSSLFVRQNSPERHPLPTTRPKGKKLPQAASGHKNRSSKSVNAPSLLSKPPEASGSRRRQPTAKGAPSEPRRSGRLTMRSAANSKPAAQKPPGALGRRWSPAEEATGTLRRSDRLNTRLSVDTALITQQSPEDSGPGRRPSSTQEAPARARRSDRMIALSTADHESVTRESQETSTSLSQDAPSRRRQSDDHHVPLSHQSSPTRSTSSSTPEELNEPLTSRRIRGRRSRLVLNHFGHESSEPENTYPQSKEAMQLGQQQQNWKLLIRLSHKMKENFNPAWKEIFRDIMEPIDYLRQWYDGLSQLPEPPRGFSTNDARLHRKLLESLLGLGNRALDYIHDVVVEDKRPKRGCRLFERFEACILPAIIELTFAIFDAYHSDPKGFSEIYDHLHGALSVLYNICDRMTILTKERYVLTTTKTTNLLRPLQKLIEASELGLLEPTETQLPDRDVEEVESSDEDMSLHPPATPFTDAEGRALLDGLLKHQGPRRYVEIIRDYSEELVGRTISELQDEARYICAKFLPQIEEELRTREGQEKWQWLLSVQE
ncbi:hypothetical protein BDW74DRAFT_172492 [Aspergillus multicolor]|uniref:uncharacterized protein n=1 Tax=Aspergillus multicolor TaxID=41759 RepID=UPI003CCD5CCE